MKLILQTLLKNNEDGHQHYHLILLDVMMGEISGFKMANILKKDKKTAIKCLLIFITAKDTENDTVTGFNLGSIRLYFETFLPA
jgi:DNA-binding response OmpR family regulator